MGRASDFYEVWDSGDVALSGISGSAVEPQVPSGQTWLVQGIILRTSTTGSGGARDFAIQLRNSLDSETLIQFEPANAVGAGSTAFFNFSNGLGRVTTIDGIYRQQGLPVFIMRGGESLRVVDESAVDGADVVRIRVTYLRQFPGR